VCAVLPRPAEAKPFLVWRPKTTHSLSTPQKNMALGITANTLTMAFLPSGLVTPASVNLFSVTPVATDSAFSPEQFALLRALAEVGSLLGFGGAAPLTWVSPLLQLSLGTLLLRFSLVQLPVRAAEGFPVANATRLLQTPLPLLGLTPGFHHLVRLFSSGFTFSVHLLCTFFFVGVLFFGRHYPMGLRKVLLSFGLRGLSLGVALLLRPLSRSRALTPPPEGEAPGNLEERLGDWWWDQVVGALPNPDPHLCSARTADSPGPGGRWPGGWLFRRRRRCSGDQVH
jgi:hypothetical protein